MIRDTKENKLLKEISKKAQGRQISLLKLEIKNSGFKIKPITAVD